MHHGNFPRGGTARDRDVRVMQKSGAQVSVTFLVAGNRQLGRVGRTFAGVWNLARPVRILTRRGNIFA